MNYNIKEDITNTINEVISSILIKISTKYKNIRKKKITNIDINDVHYDDKLAHQ